MIRTYCSRCARNQRYVAVSRKPLTSGAIVRYASESFPFRLFLILVISIPMSAWSADSEFAGLNFGVGLSLTVDVGDNDRIDEASIVDGLVRVDRESNSRARIMLESHYFFTPSGGRDGKFLALVDKQNFGVAPFVAIQPGTDDIIEAIGPGVMVGFKRATADENDNSSWNLGIGAVVDPNVQTLGSGLSRNQPLPGMETEVRFREKAQVGVLVLVSFTF